MVLCPSYFLHMREREREREPLIAHAHAAFFAHMYAFHIVMRRELVKLHTCVLCMSSGYLEGHLQGEAMYGSLEQMKLTAKYS